MNFIVCWHILPHIFNIYDVISMFYINLWGFTNDLLYFGYSPAGQENPILCIFFAFRELNKVKWSYDFGDVNISSREAPGEHVPHKKGQKGQKSPGGTCSWGGRTTLALSLLGSLMRLIFSPMDSVWRPKNLYIKDFPRLPRREHRRNTKTPKHQNGAWTSED
jgi:hypothetical protein